MSAPLIELRGIHRSYGSGEALVRALEDVDLTIQRGDFSIGEGAWKAFDIVANDVVIKFRITAAAK